MISERHKIIPSLLPFFVFVSSTSVYTFVSPTMEILGEETNTTSPRSHAWLLIFAVALVSLHLFYLLTVVLYSGVQFFLVWNEIFRTQRPKTLQTELVTQIYHHTLSVDVPTCPICLIDYSTSWNVSLLRVSLETIAIVITNSLDLFILVVIIVVVDTIVIIIIIIMHTIDDGDVISHGKHCHHLFHNDCLTLWLQKQPSCPCCRLAISEPPPGCAEEEMQEDDYVHDPYGTERLWLYIKWSMAVCGIA